MQGVLLVHGLLIDFKGVHVYILYCPPGYSKPEGKNVTYIVSIALA